MFCPSSSCSCARGNYHGPIVGDGCAGVSGEPGDGAGFGQVGMGAQSGSGRGRASSATERAAGPRRSAAHPSSSSAASAWASSPELGCVDFARCCRRDEEREGEPIAQRGARRQRLRGGRGDAWTGTHRRDQAHIRATARRVSDRQPQRITFI